MTALALIFATVGPIPAFMAWWDERRYRHLDRALRVHNEMPAGREREAWGRIAEARSLELRERLQAQGSRDLQGGMFTGALATVGALLQAFQLHPITWWSMGLMLWLILFAVIGTLMAISGHRRKRDDRRRFIEEESPLLR